MEQGQTHPNLRPMCFILKPWGQQAGCLQSCSTPAATQKLLLSFPSLWNKAQLFNEAKPLDAQTRSRVWREGFPLLLLWWHSYCTRPSANFKLSLAAMTLQTWPVFTTPPRASERYSCQFVATRRTWPKRQRDTVVIKWRKTSSCRRFCFLPTS